MRVIAGEPRGASPRSPAVHVVALQQHAAEQLLQRGHEPGLSWSRSEEAKRGICLVSGLHAWSRWNDPAVNYTRTCSNKTPFSGIYSQCWLDELRLWVFQILHWPILPSLPLLLCNLVPDLRVDPQGPGQGEAGPGAGDPAAQRAGHGADDAVHLAELLQARSAEGVVAVQEPRDPVAARVLVAAHDTLQLLVDEHDERGMKTSGGMSVSVYHATWSTRDEKFRNSHQDQRKNKEAGRRWIRVKQVHYLYDKTASASLETTTHLQTRVLGLSAAGSTGLLAGGLRSLSTLQTWQVSSRVGAHFQGSAAFR